MPLGGGTFLIISRDGSFVMEKHGRERGSPLCRRTQGRSGMARRRGKNGAPVGRGKRAPDAGKAERRLLRKKTALPPERGGRRMAEPPAGACGPVEDVGKTGPRGASGAGRRISPLLRKTFVPGRPAREARDGHAPATGCRANRPGGTTAPRTHVRRWGGTAARGCRGGRILTFSPSKC